MEIVYENMKQQGTLIRLGCRYRETEMVNSPSVQSFKYLGSTIDRGGGASKVVENRVTKAWSKWQELSGVICDKKIPKN